MVDIFTSFASFTSVSINLSQCLLAAAAAAVIEPPVQAVDANWAFTIRAGIFTVACIFAEAE